MHIPYVRLNDPFPNPNQATREGIVAYGGDLSHQRLIHAYQVGVFPWYNESDPILWWSPDPRCVLFPQDIHITRSLAKRIRNAGFEVRFDTNFSEVIRSCRKVNGRDEEGTWLQPDMIEAYEILHELGYAHSVETYLDDKLVGGLYGISLGNAFFGESMFSYEKDASKVALAFLANWAESKNFSMIDCQVASPHLLQMGAVTIAREDFLELLADSNQHETLVGSWKGLENSV